MSSELRDADRKSDGRRLSLFMYFKRGLTEIQVYVSEAEASQRAAGSKNSGRDDLRCSWFVDYSAVGRSHLVLTHTETCRSDCDC